MKNTQKSWSSKFKCHDNFIVLPHFLLVINVYKLPNVWGILCRASFEIFGKNIQDRDAFRQTLRTD